MHHQRNKKVGEWNYFTVFYINKRENNKAWWKVSLNLKPSRKNYSSVSNYIFSFCCRCFVIFGDSFYNNVYWSVLFEMSCRICFSNLYKLLSCSDRKVERTPGDTWILLILLATIFWLDLMEMCLLTKLIIRVLIGLTNVATFLVAN